jgi:hypothetical protein
MDSILKTPSELTCDLEVRIEIDDSWLIICTPESEDYLPFSIKTKEFDFNDSTYYRIKIKKMKITFPENKALNISHLTCDLKVTIEMDDSCLIMCTPQSEDYLPFSIRTEQFDFNDSTDYRIKIINIVHSYWKLK